MHVLTCLKICVWTRSALFIFHHTGPIANTFKVLISEGQTCTSAGLAAITSAAECHQAISAINAENAKKGKQHGGRQRTTSQHLPTTNRLSLPSGCSASNKDQSGYYNMATTTHWSAYRYARFNTATTTRAVGSNIKGIFCRATSTGM